MDAGYRAMADLLNCAEDELTLGSSTSLNCYVLAQAVRRLVKALEVLFSRGRRTV